MYVGFQSTHPHGVRPLPLRITPLQTGSFNPRTHTGCDALEYGAGGYRYSFNPRTHTGCDHLLEARRGAEDAGFNPRTHTGCDKLYYRTLPAFDGFNPRTHTGCDHES